MFVECYLAFGTISKSQSNSDIGL